MNHTLSGSTRAPPPAVINHQAEQIANARRRAAEGSLAPYTIPPPCEYTFFFPDGCMAQRSRCPGGRPSVSA